MNLRWLVLCCAWFVWIAPAQAWNDLGHYLVAKLAYDQLSAAERQRVFSLLKEHPHYTEYLAAGRPDSVPEDEWVFWRAAAWSDWIRPPKDGPRDAASQGRFRFHRGPWHYINYPYRAGQNDAPFPQPLPNKTNVIEQIGRSVAIARGDTIEDDGAVAELTVAQNRAVRICWMFHLIGDLHQPLHAAALVDETRFPGEAHDDLGGNRLAIRPFANEPPLRLHWYWDQLLGTDSRATFVQSLAKELPRKISLESLRDTEAKQRTHAADWARESFELAKVYVYLKGELPLAIWDDVEGKKIPVNQVPVLPERAANNARELAERRVMMAGFRLARELREVSAAR